MGLLQMESESSLICHLGKGAVKQLFFSYLPEMQSGLLFRLP